MWYAVQTQPNREFLAKEALQTLAGVEVYLPTLHIKPVNPRSRKRRPFFPGYLFVQVDLQEIGMSAIQWLPGVVRVVGAGDLPVPIPGNVLTEIRQHVQLVQAEDPNGLGRFRRGERVRINSGPLQGYEGMFDMRLNGRVRVQVLIECLGHVTAAELDVQTLTKVTPDRRRPQK
jgi:transcriptional antiterminator RfaH